MRKILMVLLATVVLGDVPLLKGLIGHVLIQPLPSYKKIMMNVTRLAMVISQVLKSYYQLSITKE